MKAMTRKPYKETLSLFTRHGGVVVMVVDPDDGAFEIWDTGVLLSRHFDPIGAEEAYETHRSTLEEAARAKGLIP